MLDIDLVLQAVADRQGKRKGDLKRSYNSIKKKKIEDNYDKVLPEENFKRLILLGVITKLGMDVDDLDEVIEGVEIEELDTKELGDPDPENEEEFDDDEEDEIVFEEDDDDGFDEFDDPDEMGKEFAVESSWEDIFDATADPKEGSGDYERLETLLIMTGVEYILKLVDPTEMPYKHEGISDFPNKKTGNKEPYTTRAVDVTLVDLSPERKFREKYESGDNRGSKCFVRKKDYKFWMSEAAFKWFKKFWVGLDRRSPDGREWTYEKVKKAKVTKHIFGEA